MKKIIYIVNPHSGVGKKRDIIHAIRQSWKKKGNNTNQQIILTEHHGHALELAKEYRDKVDIIVAVGGDGTVNEVGSGLVGSNTALGIIPAGSGNGLSRELNIPSKIVSAIEVIEEGYARTIDVMRIQDYYSLNVAGVGFDAYISHKFAKSKVRGPIQYMRLIAKEYPKYKTKKYLLEIDEQEYTRKAFLVSFANSAQWGNNIRIAPTASVDDGLIDVCVVSEFPNYAVPSLLFSLFNQSIERNKYDEVIKAKIVELNNPEPLFGHVDGEPVEFSPHAKVRIVPQALKVIVPSPEYLQNSSIIPSDIPQAISDIKGTITDIRDNIRDRFQQLLDY
ncbi:MAG: diacylglycerol kinase family lipid kinase [Bacteroidia bacterium]|nr:diacylglycerol kinase family lipid kinase [Bacteroidia bacterium]